MSVDYHEEAMARLAALVGSSDEVFYERQLEVRHEKDYFHWVTGRAIRELEARRILTSNRRDGRYTKGVKTIRRAGLRYYTRKENELVRLIDGFSDPQITRAIGRNLESLTLDGFTRHQFVLMGRDVNQYGGRSWTKTNHDLDFIFQRDGAALGIECKNTLAYIDYDELRTKIRLCAHLHITPVFVVRAMPKDWINEIRLAGGFTLLLRWWLFPPLLQQQAHAITQRLGYDVGTPERLEDGTMQRFLNWWEPRHWQWSIHRGGRKALPFQ